MIKSQFKIELITGRVSADPVNTGHEVIPEPAQHETDEECLTLPCLIFSMPDWTISAAILKILSWATAALWSEFASSKQLKEARH